MTGQLVAAFWREYQGLCLLALMTLAMAGGWLWVLREYHQGRHQTARHWHSGYNPPEFTLPSKWSLKDLNKEYEHPAVSEGLPDQSTLES
jgi:hypothetical protein